MLMLRRMVSTLASLAFAVGFSSVIARAQPPEGRSTPKMAEEVFKSIQVMKGVPAGLMNPTMEFFRTALGMRCSDCHVSEQYAREDKPAKQMARKMMRMTAELNKDFFDGRLAVTCYTCHQGSSRPAAMFPAIAPDPKPEDTGAKDLTTRHAGEMPSVDEVLSKFLAAVGGAGSIEKISTQRLKGSVTDVFGDKHPMEILFKAPERRIAVMHLASGDSFTLSNGDVGWNRSPTEATVGSQAHGAREEDLDLLRLQDLLWFSGRMKQVFGNLRVERTANVEGHDAYVISARRQGSDGAVAHVELYFETDSGLLRRLRYEGESLYGSVPVFEVDFFDYTGYRAGGVNMPSRWTVNMARAGVAQRFTYQVDAVQRNIPIADSEFVVPATIECILPRCSGPTKVQNSKSGKQ